MAGGSGGVAYPSLSLYGHFKSDTTHPLNDVATGGNGYCAGTRVHPVQASPVARRTPSGPASWTARSSRTRNARHRRPGLRCGDRLGRPVRCRHAERAGRVHPTGHGKDHCPPHGDTRGHRELLRLDLTDPFPGGTISTSLYPWGDSTTTTGTSASASHTYAAAGTFGLKLTVTDKYGRTGSVTTSVTVH